MSTTHNFLAAGLLGLGSRSHSTRSHIAAQS